MSLLHAQREGLPDAYAHSRPKTVAGDASRPTNRAPPAETQVDSVEEPRRVIGQAQHSGRRVQSARPVRTREDAGRSDRAARQVEWDSLTNGGVLSEIRYFMLRS